MSIPAFFIATFVGVISLKTYWRNAPPTIPRIWAEFVSRGEGFATVRLVVSNHTDRPVTVHGVSVAGRLVGDPFRAAPANPDAPWEYTGTLSPEWNDSLMVERKVPSGEKFENFMAVSISETADKIELSIRFSISVIRKTVKSSTIAAPVIIPAITENATK
jgi:hypothetical protein